MAARIDDIACIDDVGATLQAQSLTVAFFAIVFSDSRYQIARPSRADARRVASGAIQAYFAFAFVNINISNFPKT